MKSRLPQGFGGGKNDMVQRFQAIQEQLQAKTEEIEAKTFSAKSGGGAVEATVTGKKTVESLNINPEVIDPDDKEMLEDLILSAVNEALNQVDDVTEKEMGAITGGMPIPGLN